MMHAPDDSTTAGDWRNIRFDVLEQIDKLPSLSTVIHEFLVLSRQEYFTARDFEEVINKDQALVARVLKVANSGLYARSRTVPSIAEAVVLIGLDNLKRIVYAVSTEGLTRRNLKRYRYHPDGGFWMHAMAVGQAARVFANAAPAADLGPEEAFVAGLLHDVAKLIIDDFLPDGEPGPVALEAEREAVGLDHAELAEYMLKQWNLPPAITDAVRGHHGSLPDPDRSPGGILLGLAEQVCDLWGVGRRDDADLGIEAPSSLFLPYLENLGLDEAAWDGLIWDIRQQLTGIEDLYSQDG